MAHTKLISRKSSIGCAPRCVEYYYPEVEQEDLEQHVEVKDPSDASRDSTNESSDSSDSSSYNNSHANIGLD